MKVSNMKFKFGLAVSLLSSASMLASANPAPKFCPGSKCAKCPVQLTSEGSGYPHCVVYKTKDVFSGQGFSGLPGGGYKAYIHVPKQDPGCGTIIKSPAGTQKEGCGKTIGAFNNPTCAVLDLDTTFMVQFCCGTGDCTAAGDPGAKRSIKFARDYNELLSAGNAFSVYLQHSNGTTIEPLEVGPPPMVTRSEHLQPEKLERDVEAPMSDAHFELLDDNLVKRGKCNGKWKPDTPADAEYTIPAAHTEIVATNVEGPATITITKERSQSFTTSMDLGFDDIISLGISFSLTKETSDSKAYQFTIKAGQSGSVGFTPTLRCSRGSGMCNGKKVSGRACTGFKQAGSIAGTYAVITTS